MHPDHEREARSLARFVDASPSPFHAVASTAARLEALGFEALDERASWSFHAGRHYVARSGSLVAWVVPEGLDTCAGFRIVGAHTDSPNLRVKPRPDGGRAGFRQLGVEVYGGVLLNSWLNRDLGLSGRVWLRGGDEPTQSLFRIDRPILTLPQLAIHLHPEIRSDGLKLNPQSHMSPVWALEDDREHGFRDLLAAELGVGADQILSWDAMCHDVQPSALVGEASQFLAAPRLDNLCSCHCALEGLVRVLEQGTSLGHIPVISFFDHEEVGSASHRGAQGSLLRDLLERTVVARGGAREDYHRAIANSVCVSADMAHATHPNYVAQHEPDHHLHLGAGPVIKINANQRYATDGETEALFQAACERADVPFQKWVNRTDLGCGSTIGPATAAELGIRTVDVGTPQLSMHSARELCGTEDPHHMVRALASFWEMPC